MGVEGRVNMFQLAGAAKARLTWVVSLSSRVWGLGKSLVLLFLWACGKLLLHLFSHIALLLLLTLHIQPFVLKVTPTL